MLPPDGGRSQLSFIFSGCFVFPQAPLELFLREPRCSIVLSPLPLFRLKMSLRVVVLIKSTFFPTGHLFHFFLFCLISQVRSVGGVSFGRVYLRESVCGVKETERDGGTQKRESERKIERESEGKIVVFFPRC